MLNSIIQQRGQVAFPAFMAERVYMREFRKETGLPADLSRWQPTVDAMLDGVDTDLPIFIMVDQGIIQPGNTHRRPGLHIDGYWHPQVMSHRGQGGHRGQPSPWPQEDHKGRHGNLPARHSSSRSGWDVGNGWAHGDFSEPEALILASDIAASRALSGVYNEMPGEGGDCSHVNVEGMSEVILRANTVYAGNVTMLHESLPVAEACQRTLVRLSVPGWTPEV
ncbi:hypothetical protein HWB92_gp065 [Serratia phage vB_SmaA_3M]|uniref:Uncharacterized protein n=1 Tax=Serratia phage vB_SmaA_3M TaxID=2419930 RepID=A0A3G2YS43_9CAUD|nr:hypothetical protein HWB92_gp065 [Serratia phage vB_SmaA_3M]AYP28323.1 hypothetical protein 3M_067 [Serratia phage vB_SmaA_3M]